jgi:hypothetical protein
MENPAKSEFPPMLPFLIVLFVIAGLAALVWSSDIHATIAFALDRGGIWARYTTSLGIFIFSGYQFRIMSGHRPRAWKRNPLTGSMKPVDFQETVGNLFQKKWKPAQIPIRGAADIGVNILIEELNVDARLGVQDNAAATALLCGGIVTALQALRAAGTRGGFVPAGSIVVRPVFNRAHLSVRFKCILAIKASHIIRELVENAAGRKRDGQSSD